MSDKVESTLNEDVAAIPSPVPDYVKSEPETKPDPEPKSKPEPKAEPKVEAAEPPEGWDKVDFEKIPQEHRKDFQQRFNRLYFQIKQSQRERSEERKLYQGLESKIDNLLNAQETDRQQAKIDLISEKAKKAFADGDHEGGIDTLKKLVKAERELASKTIPAPKPAETETPQAFSKDETDYLAEFVEKNEWARIGAPHHKITKDTLSRFLAAGIPLKEAVDATREALMPIVENSNGPDPIAQAVLGSNRSATQQEKPSLNEYEQSVARKFFPSLKADEAYARYLRGKGG